MSVVIDASVAMTWCFEDKATPATDAITARIVETGASLPSLWHLEVAKVLVPVPTGRETPDRA